MKSPPKKECSTCYGYGLWDMGDPSPMGPIDASDGLPTQACPECGANANPSKTEHELNVEALYPTNQDIDAHNDKIATMLELVQRNQELKERVRELEAEKETLRMIILDCPECERTIKGLFHQLTKKGE